MFMNPRMVMENMMGMMRHAGIDPHMIRRCHAMMFAPMFLDSPAAIRGQAESLGLSDEQKQQLLDIEKEAREKARSVLTEEQTKRMGPIPETPMAMIEMCQEMPAKMMPVMQQMMPMMGMMMGGKRGAQGSDTQQDN